MESITQHYIIDLSSNNNYVQVAAVEGDGYDTRYMEIELIQNGTAYEIDTDTTYVTIMGTTAAGGEVWNTGTVTDDGYILFELTYTMMSAPGRGIYQVALMSTEENTQLKSFPFYVIVTKAAVSAEEIVESNEFQVLSEVLSAAEESAEAAATSADEAAASATAAATSETNAATSEANAATSEANAATSESNAATSETNAATSATNAANSATAAATSATAAATSATNAATSATESADSATESANSASAAATSEANAATSEENAATSEANAATSEANAATSESNAATSATNAATSETNAATSATNAATSETNAATSATDAAASASESSDYATLSESYAVGGTGSRTGEDYDNAKYYLEQCEEIAENLSGALKPMGTIYFADLDSQEKETGYMYNIIDEFTTTEEFKEGAGVVVSAGSNVYYTADGYWDVLAGSPVSGVKGDAETDYRTGNVNITKANIGLEYAVNVVISDSEPTQAENDYWLADYE